MKRSKKFSAGQTLYCLGDDLVSGLVVDRVKFVRYCKANEIDSYVAKHGANKGKTIKLDCIVEIDGGLPLMAPSSDLHAKFDAAFGKVPKLKSKRGCHGA